MDAECEATLWLASELAWEARLAALRSYYAERHGWDVYPAKTWDERVAA